MIQMKAISLWQPWASLMASGAKQIETRSWRPWLKHGQQILIHASKRWTAEERELLADPFFLRYLVLAERRGMWNFEQPPLGALIAVATFDQAMPTEAIRQQISAHEYAFGNYAQGRWAWKFSEIRPIRPIPWRGAQGLFEVRADLDLEYLDPALELGRSDG
jgi:hypothetical protein